MSTQFGGEPAVIENSLPTAKNISSTTNATPIVITTTAAHGLNVGDYFICNGADDPALIGVYLMAGSVTSTTVVALLAPSGANTVGTLLGGANGTLLSLTFGTTYAIPSGSDKPNAASVNVALEALGDRTAFLEATMQDGRQKKVTFNTTVTIDLSTGRSQVIGTLGANITIDQRNMVIGRIYTITVEQDGGGTWTTTWSGDFVFGTYSNVAAPNPGQMTVWTFECIREPATGNPALFAIGKASFF